MLRYLRCLWFLGCVVPVPLSYADEPRQRAEKQRVQVPRIESIPIKPKTQGDPVEHYRLPEAQLQRLREESAKSPGMIIPLRVNPEKSEPVKQRR